MRTKRFADLCAGIGGFRLAADERGWECVLSCENGRLAAETYRLNFTQEHAWVDDLQDVACMDFDYDVLLAGFPCQPFSQAATQTYSRKGVADERHLFPLLVECLRRHKPESFLLENVPGFKHIDGGRVFDDAIGQLNRLGYNVGWRIVDAAHFVPQRRKRLFIWGMRDFRLLAERALPACERTLDDVICHEGDKSLMLSERAWEGWKARQDRHPNKALYNLCAFGDTLDAPAPCQTTTLHGLGSVLLWEYDLERPRFLSVDELRQLMGFPVGFRLATESRDTAQRLYGNAVVPQVVGWLLDWLWDE